MNGATDWEDYFSGATGFCVLILPDEDKTLLSVKFQSSDDLVKFVTFHKWTLDSIKLIPTRLSNGEIIRKLSDNHLFIEIPK